jgi:ketosteroid isomerase-like protein
MTGDRWDQIDARLRQLEDRAAIAELTARYAIAANQGWAGEAFDLAALPEVFAPDAVWHSQAMGVRVEGLDAIVTAADHATRATDFAMHSYTNPSIHIDGDDATARWLLYIASRRHRGPANLVFMEDIVGYVRLAAGWRIQSVERRFGMELVAGASSHRDG